MSNNKAFRTPSLLERAAEIYDFSSGARISPLAPIIEARPLPVEAAPPEAAARPVAPATPSEPQLPELQLTGQPPAEQQGAQQQASAFAPARPKAAVRASRKVNGPRGEVDREPLREAGFVLPDAPVTGLAEEFRIIKRQLLLGASGRTGIAADKRQTVLVCSAHPDEGKTFCAVNLALSLATEKDVEVLLVDGDFAKPEILSILGLEGGAGLIDAILDPAADAEDFVIRTDIPGLSVLPAGRQANNVTELLAAERTRTVLADLTVRSPQRVVIFDSPPALMASPASVLASHVGQVMMVVRADRTNEADLKEAIGLLSGCDTLSLMLNGTGFAATGRRFGSYYGYGQ